MEAVFSVLIPAIVESVFGSLAEAVGLSDWLRQRLGRDPEKLAFQQTLTQALTDSATHYPGRDLRYFAEILCDIGGPLLARTLQPSATLPTADELTTVWLNHLTVDSLIHYQAEFEEFATHFLDRLQFHLENQQPLQWIAQARRQRSSEEAIRRMADAAEQSVVNLDALRQEITSMTATLVVALQTSGGSTVTTAGGAYIGGNVNAHHFAGRDLTIKNYFIQGLPRLVIDYSSRIQDFLLEYLGSKRKKVPFGGRQQQLAELNAWLDDPTAPPYYLMTAEAGRGKSALACRWLAQLTTRTDLDVIFVPISIRFETATQDVVFAALAARLANLYESEPEKLPPASLTAEQWKGVCQSYLRREPPAGKQLVVILDGLDEATGWTPGRGLFSVDPPDGLRVLVTARSRPSESEGGGWANTLNWEDPQLAQVAMLSGLERHGVEETLASMGNPLDKLANNVDVVGELHRLSEGDPLLVRLYVDALLAQGEAVSTLCVEDLHTIHPGLIGYFERWWRDQHEQWRLEMRDPIVEQANLRTLLNAIAGALGPLTLDNLSALHPDLEESMLVRRLLVQVNRWLVGDGKTQGYSYSHPRLAYYFWEQLGKHEKIAWDDRFCVWGRRVLASLKDGNLEPKLVPRYLLLHYVAHLERAGATLDSYYVLITNEWRKAWEEIDASHLSFMNDIRRGWVQVQHAYTQAQYEISETIIFQVKASLCQASIIALTNNISAELLALAVEHEIRTPLQALAITRLVRDEEQRSRTLVTLAPYLNTQQHFDELIRMIDTMPGESIRIGTLCGLAPHMPIQFFEVVLSIIFAIENELICADALCKLIPHIPRELLEKVLYTAQGMSMESARAKTLCALIPYLPKLKLMEVIEEVISSAQTIWRESVRADIFCKLIPYLPEKMRRDVVEETLATTFEIWNEYDYTITLCKLIPYLSRKRRTRLINDGYRVANKIYHPCYRLDALCQLALHLPEKVKVSTLRNLLSSIRQLPSESSRIDSLFKILPYLPENLHEIALYIVLTVRRLPVLVDTIGKLVPYLQTQLIDKALNIVYSINHDLHRTTGLCEFVPYLSEEKRSHVLEDIRTDVYTIGDEIVRLKILTKIVKYLPLVERAELIKELLITSRAILDWSVFMETLNELKLYLSKPQEINQEQETIVAASEERAIADARRIKNSLERAQTMNQMLPHLTNDQRRVIFEEAVSATRKIKDNFERAQMLTKLAPYALEFQIERLPEEALVTARKIRDVSIRMEILTKLLPHLREVDRFEVTEQMFSVIHKIKSKVIQASVLSSLVKFIQEERREEISILSLAAIREMENEEARANILAQLIPHLPKQLLDESLIIARMTQNEIYRARSLRNLAPYLPRHLFNDALLSANAIQNDFGRVCALSGFTLHLLAEQRAEVIKQVLFTACEIEDDSRRRQALSIVAKDLAKWDQFSLTNVYLLFSSVLQKLSLRPRPIFLKDLTALVTFILALAGDEAPQAAEGIYHAIQEVCEWWP